MKTGENWRDGEAMSVGKLVAGSFGPQHERLRSHHDEELLPVDSPREQNESDPCRIVQAPRLDLPLDIERQLLAQEQVLGGEARVR
jgi:hypothetical protein